MKHKILIVAVLVLIPWSAFAGGLTPERLRCEYLDNPLGIDFTEPRLGWELRATDEGARGLQQSAYQVQAASSPELLAEGKPDLWDSGQVLSDETIGIVYAGEKMASRDRCHWRVRVWDQDGEPSAWSEPALWTMGLLEASDWQAKWIGDPNPPPPDSAIRLSNCVRRSCFWSSRYFAREKAGYSTSTLRTASTSRWLMTLTSNSAAFN
jgi:alpha-L-rhamnosidase